MNYLTFYEPAFSQKELEAQKTLLRSVGEAIRDTPKELVKNSYFYIQDQYSGVTIMAGRN